jgi:dihydroorotase
MTCYLTDTTDADDLARGAAEGVFTAAKIYPAHATTNSAAGVSSIEGIYPVLARMEAEDIVLCIHGEVTDHEIDVFDREKEFIARHLRSIVAAFPKLRVVFEHITTSDAVDFVMEAGPQIAATITPQHLHINRNAMLVGGIQPHNYCLPVAKREEHRLALRRAATSGSPKFFLGTDSAPHAAALKEQSVCGAGCFTAPAALELYAEAFEAVSALHQLEAFASLHGPAFYGLPPNTDRVTLKREPWALPETLPFGEAVIKPLRGGETLNWKLQ